MPFPAPALSIALLAPLAIAVSDAVPVFNVEPTCRGGMDRPGQTKLYEQCLRDESEARGALQASWTKYPAGDRATCTATAQIGVQSYVELLTCLQLAGEARQMEKKAKD
jgi:hypothetical protein